MFDSSPQIVIPIAAPHVERLRACPKCHSAQRTRRIPRLLWMRIFPNSVNMTCGQCGQRFWCLS